MGLTKVELKGLDDGTDGQIITYDANGNPVAVGPGTDGQVLTSTGAGSPPAFETPAAGVGGATGVDFNDNVKARFGTGNDFKFYHNGSGSYIENDTGVISSWSAGNHEFKSSNGNTRALFKNGDACELYYNNNKCLETRSDGGIEATDGNFIVGTSGHGIQFDTADSGSDQLLDDYETGTWSGSLIANGAPSTLHGTSTGRYTKIGREVKVTIKFDQVDVSGITTGQIIQITGLPYTSINSAARDISSNILTKNVEFDGSQRQMFMVSQNSNKWTGYVMRDDTTSTTWSTSKWNASDVTFWFTGTYTD